MSDYGCSDGRSSDRSLSSVHEVIAKFNVTDNEIDLVFTNKDVDSIKDTLRRGTPCESQNDIMSRTHLFPNIAGNCCERTMFGGDLFGAHYFRSLSLPFFFSESSSTTS